MSPTRNGSSRNESEAGFGGRPASKKKRPGGKPSGPFLIPPTGAVQGRRQAVSTPRSGRRSYGRSRELIAARTARARASARNGFVSNGADGAIRRIDSVSL